MASVGQGVGAIQAALGPVRTVRVLALTRAHPATLEITVTRGPAGGELLPDLIVNYTPAHPGAPILLDAAGQPVANVRRAVFRRRWWKWAGGAIPTEMLSWGLDARGRTPVWVEIDDPAPAAAGKG